MPSQRQQMAIAWVAAVIFTVISAAILLQLALNGVLLIQGLMHGLPYRITYSVALIAVFGVLFVGPATVCRLLWAWLFNRSDRSTVTIALLMHLLVFAAIGPALLAHDLRALLGP